MTSKVAFRARHLDVNRALPVLREHELPPEFVETGAASSAPRITHQEITTGMEKEEETEHHLQQALTAQQLFKTAEQQAIPIPDLSEITDDELAKVYSRSFKLPKSYINSQVVLFESDKVAYDADEEDLAWLEKTAPQLDVGTFEGMIQCLEDGSSAQRLVTLDEAHLFLKSTVEESLIASLYQHWLAKRSSCDSLVPTVLNEKRDGSNNNSNPYVAFRRRKEKMQTRKNRKNDELSYERMLKLRLDLCKASLLLELIKRREDAKRELCVAAGCLFERQFAAQDFSGAAVRESEAEVKMRCAAAQPLSAAEFSDFRAVVRSPVAAAALQNYASRVAASRKRRLDETMAASLPRRLSRRRLPFALDGEEQLFTHREDSSAQKRRRLMNKLVPPTGVSPAALQHPGVSALLPAERSLLLGSCRPSWRDEDVHTASYVDQEFAFRRKPGCRYAAARTEDGRSSLSRNSKFSLVGVPVSSRLDATGCRSRICHARRRVTRCRRVVLDICSSSLDVAVGVIDSKSVENGVAADRWPSTTAPASLWRDVIAEAERNACQSCDPATRVCNAKRSLCGDPTAQSRIPHANDIDALKRLHAAGESVYLPRRLASDGVEDGFFVQSTASEEQAKFLDIVKLYLDNGSLAADARREKSSKDESSSGQVPVRNVEVDGSRSNGFTSKVGSRGGQGQDRLPMINGNGNNNNGHTPVRFGGVSVTKRIDGGNGNGNSSGLPRPAENGNGKMDCLGLSHSQHQHQQSPSPLSSQPSAVDSEGDADVVLNDQVHTRTTTTTTIST